MTYIIAALIIIIVGSLDRSNAAMTICMEMYAAGALFILAFLRKNRKSSFRLFNIVFSVYIIMAYIVSLSFSANNNFLLSDPSKYIYTYMFRTSYFLTSEDFLNCYLGLADNNFLYNAYLNLMSNYANKSLGGMTVFVMTLCQTVWGILSSLVLYRILIRHYGQQQAFKYTLMFAICSLFLFYSTVIVRDIIIWFFFLCALDIVDSKFSVLGIVILIVLALLAWGIRLYSGVFAFSFVAYYIFARSLNSRFKFPAMLLVLVSLYFTASYVFNSQLMEQTLNELDQYDSFSLERSAGGVYSQLMQLPTGINHLAVVLFTMIRPLPPFGIFEGANTLSHFVMSSMQLIAGFFWFVVFYSLLGHLFFRMRIFKIPFEKSVLFILCMVFLMANASHPDIRRMLPVYPFLFLLLTDICKTNNIPLLRNKISLSLMAIYIAMAFGMSLA